jgi:hypothetical protein
MFCADIQHFIALLATQGRQQAAPACRMPADARFP